MCRIRHKTALGLHGLTHAGQQTIDRHGEGPYLDREVAIVDRMQFLLGTLVDCPGERGNRAEHLAHQVGDDQQQHRHQNQERHHGAQRTVVGDFVAKLGFLSHRNAFTRGRGLDQYAEVLAADIQRLQPIRQGCRQGKSTAGIHARRRRIGLAQTLDDHARLFIGIRESGIGGRQGRRQKPTIHELRDLAQHIVLQFMRFIESRQEREDARHDGHHEDGQRQGEGQLELNRIVQAPFATIHPTP